jgi:hypothetical protein
MRVLICALALAVTPAFAPSAAAQEVTSQNRSFAVETLMQKARLDQPTADKVQAIVDKYRDKIDGLRHQDRELVRALRVHLATTTADRKSDKALAKIADELLSNRKKLRDLRADRLRAIEKALPPPAFARLLVAMPRIDRALWKHSLDRQQSSDGASNS